MIDINTLIKNAALSRDKVALNAYKNIKAEFEKFKYAQKLPRNIDSETKLRIISNYSRKLEDSIKQFSEAHRDDLVASYTSELEVVKKLLPAPVNESQIRFSLDEWICETKNLEKDHFGLTNPRLQKKEMGTAIKYLKSKFPTADGKMISDVVKTYIV